MSTLFKKVTSAVSVAALLASTVGTSIVSAADAKLPFAEALADKSFITKQATEAGYRLSDTATRQEVAGTALKIKGTTLPETYSCKNYFTDVTTTKPASWSCRAAELAADEGIVSKANTKFRPTDNITRAEALAMVLKAAKIEIMTGAAASFNDTSIEWQKNVANTAVAKKIVSANPSFRPNDSVKRGELFVFAANALGLDVATDDLIDFNDLINGGSGSTSTGATSTGATSTGTTTVVKAGDISVGLNPASAAAANIPKNGTIAAGKFDFSAG